MDNASAFIESFLEHAGSQYYDPVKAHEYYLKTRELKGRRSVSALRGKKKKEAWTYVQYRVGEDRKQAFKSAAEAHKADVTTLHANGKAIRSSISEKIKSVFAQISGDTKAQIAALPAGLSKEERAKQVADIRANAKNQRAITSEDRKAQTTDLADNLKSALTSAQDSYKQVRESIKSKYEATLNREYEAIRSGSV